MTVHALADVLPGAMPVRGRRRTRLRLVLPPDQGARARVAPPPDPGRRSGRDVLAELGNDPAYLAFKEALGEPLSATERGRLEAYRAALEGDRPGGGS